MSKITRRKFVKNSIALGGATIVGSHFPGLLKGSTVPDPPDIISISSDSPMEKIPRLLEPLGGIGNFVKSGQSVGVLVNSPWTNPGTYTHPDVVLAFLKHCKEAGAGNLVCFKPVREGYWEESLYHKELEDLIDEFSYGEERIEMEIPGGVELKKAEIFKIFMEIDVYVSIPVAKHHSGTNFSGNLKGLMGVSSRNTNRHMHSPDGEYTYDKQSYLSQCIADLNLIRQPDLCIVDAIECVLDSGPRGPGQTTKPQKILAGTDPVALDAYSANLIGFDVHSISSIARASHHGMGNAELTSLKVLQL